MGNVTFLVTHVNPKVENLLKPETILRCPGNVPDALIIKAALRSCFAIQKLNLKQPDRCVIWTPEKAPQIDGFILKFRML